MEKMIGIISCNYGLEYPEGIGERRPLAAIPFAGRYQMLDFALSNMVNAGIRTVGIILPSNIRPVLDHLGAGKEWKLGRKEGGLVILQGSDSGIFPRSNGFLLRDLQKNTDYLENNAAEYVVLSNCSNVVNMDCRQAFLQHKKDGADITLIVKELIAEQEDEFGLIAVTDRSGWVLNFEQAKAKSGQSVQRFANMIIIKRRLLLDIIHGHKNIEYEDFMEILRIHASKLKIKTFSIPGYFGRIDSKQTYFQRSMEMLRPEIQKELFWGSRQILTRVRDRPPTKYGPISSVHDSLVSSGCLIHGTVSQSILFRGAVIEAGAQVINCIIMKNCRISRGAILENVIVTKNAMVHPDTVIKGRPDHVMVLNRDDGF